MMPWKPHTARPQHNRVWQMKPSRLTWLPTPWPVTIFASPRTTIVRLKGWPMGCPRTPQGAGPRGQCGCGSRPWPNSPKVQQPLCCRRGLNKTTTHRHLIKLLVRFSSHSEGCRRRQLQAEQWTAEERAFEWAATLTTSQTPVMEAAASPDAGDDVVPAPPPVVRSFAIHGDNPGPRWVASPGAAPPACAPSRLEPDGPYVLPSLPYSCGHTLTTIAGPDGDLTSAKLVMFGEARAPGGLRALN